MKFERASGILLHPTSLPGPYGIGDLGPQAYAWVDFLAASGCKLWQVLPLGPTGYGDSPYQCFSAFAGNPYLISPDFLLRDDLLHPNDLVEKTDFPAGRVDFGALIPWKLNLLERAFLRFSSDPQPVRRDPSTLLPGLTARTGRTSFDIFCAENASWLDDYALFMALKEAHGGGSWENWPEPLRKRDPAALAEARNSLTHHVLRFTFYQFLFFQQWHALKAYANERGVQIIGDIPIFVAYDSADVWAHPELFYLDEDGRPTVVAGVPPDYFSPTGQLWGNPLYRWDVHKATGYTWWLERFRAILKMVDILRLDHFRGFAGYWEVPAGNPTAEIGRWAPGPGLDFLAAVSRALSGEAVGVDGCPSMPIIAEDLGLITPDVIAMRDQFGLPGMKILQFGFSGPDNPFLPHHYPQNCVAYTGTHDNDTARGWYESAPEEERNFALRYLGRERSPKLALSEIEGSLTLGAQSETAQSNFAWELIRAVWASVAVYSLSPMQDLLNLGTEARMNYPSRLGGNWGWRMGEGAMSEALQVRLRELNYLYGRFGS
ncbi:MAG: 4-alpha-glucanotransferase [Chloroflexi bacterium]|nr:4-alpha-glucanotransferase [Chloroflexota bacterium]